jgi:hypothetical protein
MEDVVEGLSAGVCRTFRQPPLSPLAFLSFLGFHKGENVVRKVLLSVLAVLVLLGTAPFAIAQDETKPLVTVSFSGYDKLKANVGVIGQLGGNAKLADGLDKMLQAMTGGRGLAGLDTKRPWGAAYFLRPDSPPNQPKGTTYGFIPVTDLGQFVETLKAVSRGRIKASKDKDVYQLQAGGPPLLMQQKGDWAVVAVLNPFTNDLDNAPADPAKLLGDLPKRYDLAVRLSVKDVPEAIRQQFLSQLQTAADHEMAQKPGESEAEYAGRMLGAKGALQAFTTLANELDEVVLGWTVDASTNKTYLDVEVIAKAGTKLADQFAEMKPGKTKFAGLRMLDAALAAGKTATLSDADAAWAKDLLAVMHKSFMSEINNQTLTEDQVKLIKGLADDVLDVLQKTVAAKHSDGGLAILLNPGALTVVVGVQIVDGGKIEDVLKKLVEADPKAAQEIKLNTDTHEGIRFHTITVPTKDPKMAALVGEMTEIVLGIADDRLFVAVGRDAAKTLKKVIDDSKAGADKELPPFELKLSLSKIVKFIGEVADNDMAKMKVAMVAGIVSQAGNGDHIVVTGSPIAQGVRVRIEIEEGLLKALSPMLQMGMGVGGPPPGAPSGPPPGTPAVPPEPPPAK